MSFIFKRRSRSPSLDKLGSANLQLEQLQKENAELRRKIEESKTLYVQNKATLKTITKQITDKDKCIQEMKENQNALDALFKENDSFIRKLREEKGRILAHKASLLQSENMRFGGHRAQSVQDVLDMAEKQDDLIFFRDSHGSVWQIVKKPEANIEDMNDITEEEEVSFDISY